MADVNHSQYTQAKEIPFVQARIIGAGSVGIVDQVEGTRRPFRNRILARKRIHLNPGATDLNTIRNEVNILKQMNHRHVIELVATYLFEGSYAILMAPCAEKNLEQYLQLADSGALDTLDPEKNASWFRCLINGIDYIHQHHIQHRDIKPTNILIHQGNIIFADFGISTVASYQTIRTTEIGQPRARTPEYCAPEVEDGHTRDWKADIFSLGAVFLEMLSVNFEPGMLTKLRNQIQAEGRLSYARNVHMVGQWFGNEVKLAHGSSSWKSQILVLCQRMLHPSQDQRPGATELISWWALQPSLSQLPRHCSCSITTTKTRHHSNTKLDEQLRQALSLGHKMTVDHLLDEGAELYTIDFLVAAAEGGLRDLVENLLVREHRLSGRSGATRVTFQRHSNGDEPLLLRSDGVDINEKNQQGLNALFAAAKNGRDNVVRLLLEKGADVNSTNQDGQTPLLTAVEHGHKRVVRLLLRAAPHDLALPLEKAVEKGHGTTAKLILESESEVHEASSNYGSLFLKAAEHGHQSIMEILMQRGADTNTRTKNRSTALHLAAANGHWEATMLLLRLKVDIDAKDEDGRTALHAATGAGQKKLMRLLLKHGAHSSTADREGITALHLAAGKGNVAMVRELLGHENYSGIDVASFFYPNMGNAPVEVRRVIESGQAMCMSAESGHKNVTQVFLQESLEVSFAALLLAVENNNDAAVLALLASDYEEAWRYPKVQQEIYTVSRKTDAFSLAIKQGPFRRTFEGSTEAQNAPDNTQTGLHAFRKRVDELVSLLFGHSASDKAEVSSYGALHFAAGRGYARLVEVLLQSGYKVNETDDTGQTSLHKAAYAGRTELVKLLLENGAEVNKGDCSHCTPLHVAASTEASTDNLLIVMMLLDAKASIDLRGPAGGQTPLCLAAGAGRQSVVHWLLEQGANRHVPDESTQTALHKAARAGHPDVVELLLQGNHNMDYRDMTGKTALHMAARGGKAKVVEQLLKAGSKVNAKDDAKATPLHHAAMWGNRYAVQVLLGYQADTGAQDFGKETAVHKAAANGYSEVVEMLLRAGASPHSTNRSTEWVMKKAGRSSNEALLIALADAGLGCDLDNQGRETPLHLAAAGGHLAVVEVLIEQKVWAHDKNEKGEKPIAKAERNNFTDVVSALTKWMEARPKLRWRQTPLVPGVLPFS